MSPSDLSGVNTFDDAIATARILIAAALPDAPLAMPEQRLDAINPFVAVRTFYLQARRRAEP